jgi:anti-sigma B factor antagonist
MLEAMEARSRQRMRAPVHLGEPGSTDAHVGEPSSARAASPEVEFASSFRIDEERPRRTSAVLVLSGDADLHGAPELRDRLTEAMADGVGRIVVDLSAVTFIDSMALGVLLGARHRLRDHGGDLRLVVASPELRRIFELSLLDQVFSLAETRAEALSSFAVSERAD